MRVLVIGFPLPNKDIDNYTALTAPSYFDYDGLFVDPASITASVQSLLAGEREFDAFDGRPVLNAPTTASGVSAADQLRRRLDETRRVLETGGTVIVLARPNAVQGGVTGFEGCDRYAWLPAPAGMSWGPPHLVAAEGKTIRIADESHPAAGLLRKFRAQSSYRAVFDDRHAPVRQGRVIATGGGGLPIAMEFDVLNGRVLFLPILPEDTGPVRGEAAEAIVDLFLELSSRYLEDEAPYWARSQPVPGLEQAEAEVEATEVALKEAEAKVETAREHQDSLAGHRALLWADGRRFQSAIETALRNLGFAVVSEDGLFRIEDEGRTVLVECESARDEVVEWPYVRLQRRLETALLQRNEKPGGLVIVNGHRLKDPTDRPTEFTDALRAACENYRYGLMTAQTLFVLVQRALGGADDSWLAGARRRMLSRTGEIARGLVLGEVTEESDAGSIF